MTAGRRVARLAAVAVVAAAASSGCMIVHHETPFEPNLIIEDEPAFYPTDGDPAQQRSDR